LKLFAHDFDLLWITCGGLFGGAPPEVEAFEGQA